MGVFGTETSRPVHWLNTGLVEARRVGRIHDGRALPYATGLLFDGGIVGDGFKSLPLFLTCNHCVSGAADRFINAIPWTDAAVVFQLMQTDPAVKGEAAFLQLVAESPMGDLNYTLLLLDRWPGEVPGLKVTPRRPQPGDRVYVISYPLGKGLAVSLSDNHVLPREAMPDGWRPRMREDPLLFYRAPTEPGASGAPVYNEHWEVVALHVGRAGEWANFGIAVDAVLEDARGKLGGLSVPRKIRELVERQEDASPQVLKDGARYFSVFISYSHADAAFARRLYHAFESRGIRAWLDEKRMVPGDDIHEAVQQGVQESDKFLLCCSKVSLENSWWVDSEIERMFAKERQLSQAAGRKTRLVIPVVLDDYFRNDWKSGKAPELQARLEANFRDWQDEKSFGESFETLLRALRNEGP